MWLVRLARVLKLKSVTQRSFAEYHSKRNHVERVHAMQNRALSNEIFESNAVHKNFKVGNEKHQENMEHAADEMKQCLFHVLFGGRPCTVVRGVGKEERFVFNDEAELVMFLAKSEGLKNDDVTTYEPLQNELWRDVSIIWELDDSFVGS